MPWSAVLGHPGLPARSSPQRVPKRAYKIRRRYERQSNFNLKIEGIGPLLVVGVPEVLGEGVPGPEGAATDGAGDGEVEVELAVHHGAASVPGNLATGGAPVQVPLPSPLHHPLQGQVQLGPVPCHRLLHLPALLHLFTILPHLLLLHQHPVRALSHGAGGGPKKVGRQ